MPLPPSLKSASRVLSHAQVRQVILEMQVQQIQHGQADAQQAGQIVLLFQLLSFGSVQSSALTTLDSRGVKSMGANLGSSSCAHKDGSAGAAAAAAGVGEAGVGAAGGVVTGAGGAAVPAAQSPVAALAWVLHSLLVVQILLQGAVLCAPDITITEASQADHAFSPTDTYKQTLMKRLDEHKRGNTGLMLLQMHFVSIDLSV